MKRTFAAAILTWLAFLISGGSPFAAPETSETFQFNYPGWRPGQITFSGSFTGTPESNGTIGLADISSLSASLDGYADNPLPINFMRSDLLAFQFNPGLEPGSSLSFILPIQGSVFLCVGVLAFNQRDCDPGGHTPGGATGVISLLDVPYYTDETPRITPSISASVPEPPTWVTLIAGLAMLGLVRAGDVRAKWSKKVSPAS